jgi:hypothetical protein
MNPNEVSDDEIQALGLFRNFGPRTFDTIPGLLGGIEVHSVRPARRVGPDGQLLSDLVVEITQTFHPHGGGLFRGGCTLIIDLTKHEVRYFIRKRVGAMAEFSKQQKFAEATANHLRATYFGAPEHGEEPFALLHRPG